MFPSAWTRGITPMSDYKYKAFISYSHEDEKWATWLHRGLERYRIPRHIVNATDSASDRLTPIFRDREELASASSLTDAIEKAMKRRKRNLIRHRMISLQQ